MNRRTLTPLALSAPFLVALGSCVAPPAAPPPAPPPPPVAQPAPAPAPLSADWRDWPIAPGDWSYAATGEGSIARFGVPGRVPELTVRCLRAGRQLLVGRAVAAPVAGQMQVRTGYGVEQWPLTPGTGEAVANRAAMDTGFDRIAFSRGRFAVEVPGAQPLVVPAWAEVSRVIEDCRG